MERAYSTGRPPELTQKQQEQLLSELQKPQGFSSYQQIKDYIEATFGVKMSYPAVHNLVHYRWKAKLKVPAKAIKKNENSCDEFKLNFAETIKNATSESTSSFETIRIFCEDESRFGLFPVSYRRITLSGIKPITKVSYTYENFYLYGAVEPITGENFFLEMPYLNSACFQIFLDEFAKVYPNECPCS